ncbi:MAG: MFS transporter [Bacilli bacterium]
MFKKSLFNKEQWSWIMYDWANSAYSIIITTAVLPIYYKAMTNSVMSDTNSTLYWTVINTVASLCVALLGPLLGSMSDIKGYRKKIFSFLLLLGLLSTLSLAFVPYGNWGAILFLYFLTVLGFSGTNIFYDSFLIDVASDDEMDNVSANGFAYGYFGSTIPFIISILVIVFYEKLGISNIVATQFSFILTAVWWGVFSVPILKNVKQKYGRERSEGYIKKNFLQIFYTAKKVYHSKVLLIFLIAYFFYIDGVNTIIKLATIVGSDVGINADVMLIVLVITQLVAFPSTIIFGILSRKIKGATLIIIAIIIYVIVCLYAMFFLRTSVDFFTLGVMIGLVQGGIQSLSRSYFAKLINKDNSGEYFGFYNVVGKFSAILGPTLYGMTFYLTNNVSLAVGSVLSLFVIGLVLFIYAEKTLKKI